jgi:hypothetical protein
MRYFVVALTALLLLTPLEAKKHYKYKTSPASKSFKPHKAKKFKPNGARKYDNHIN